MLYYYFTQTSLSTVGFGDFAPISDFERILGCILLVVGVLVFSYFMGEFVEIINKFIKLSDDFEQSEELDQFWAAITKFNEGFVIDKEFQDRVNKFMKYKWDNDKNNCITDEYEEYLLDQMPFECRLAIFKDFLFADFLNQFRRFFWIRKDPSMIAMVWRTKNKLKWSDTARTNPNAYKYHKNGNGWLKFKTFPFIDWNNDQYQLFMFSIMRALEVRIYY